jgi:glycosyltransferase 2 family protein
MKRYSKFFLKVIISALFLFWVIFKVDWSNVLREIQSVELIYLFIYVAVVLLGMAVSAYKWKILANYKEIKIKFGDFFKFYLTGTFINNFMPSFVGGDTFKAYETGKPQGKYIEAASSVMMDRITGLFGATVLAMIFSLINFKNVINNSTLLVVNLIILLSLILDIFIAKIRNHSFWGRFKKYFPDKFAAFMIDLGTYSQSSKVLKKSIILAFVFDFIGVALANYILFMALGIKIGLLNYLSVIFLVSIIASVPISINNIGIKEWSYIAFFGAFGLDSSAVITVAIVSRFIQMFISFFALPVYLRRSRR